MKRLIVLLVAALATPALAEPVDLRVRLRSGDTWTQTSVHTRTDTRAGVTKSSTATSVVRATYTEEAAGAAAVRLDFVSFSVEGADAAAQRALAEQSKLVYPAVIEVDESLQPTRVRDWDALREKIFKAISATGADGPALEAIKANFARDAGQAASLFKEQGLVSLGQGTGLEIGETRRYDSQTPNLLGGPPIKTTGAFQLVSVDATKGRAVVTWTQTPDPASMTASLQASIEKLVAGVAPEKQAEMKTQLAGLTLERSEGCRYEVDVATGLAVSSDCTVDIKSGLPGQVAQRVDRWVITQTLPEKR